jgi:hypothetical protein
LPLAYIDDKKIKRFHFNEISVRPALLVTFCLVSSAIILPVLSMTLN